MYNATSIRQVHDKVRAMRPGAFIAVRSGEFVQFFFGQAEEVSRLLGEPLDVGRASYTTRLL